LLKYAYGKVPPMVRFGSEFRNIYSSLKRTQWQSEAEVYDHQLRQLKSILIHSYETVPYYRRLFQSIKFDPDSISTPSTITRIPFLDKEMVKKNFENLVSNQYQVSTLRNVLTGGTTGAPMSFLRDNKYAVAVERAFVLRAWRWAGYDLGDTVAVIRGDIPSAPVRGNGRAIWSYDPLGNRHILSSYDIEENNLPAYASMFEVHRPEYIHAYPSSLNLLVNLFRSNGIQVGGVHSVFTSSENLYDHQRENIESYFRCRIFDLYGNREQTCMAAQCGNSGHYHLFHEYGFTEIIDDDGHPVTEAGVMGEIVATSFTNRAMPFIRFRSGDIACFEEGVCGCGNNSRMLRRIEGRTQDYLVNLKGEKIPLTGGAGGQEPMHGFRQILDAQYYQDVPGVVSLDVVTSHKLDDKDISEIIFRLNRRYGNGLTFVVRRVDGIQKTSLGKHKMVVQKVTHP